MLRVSELLPRSAPKHKNPNFVNFFVPFRGQYRTFPKICCAFPLNPARHRL
jgi:hypothetical protein